MGAYIDEELPNDDWSTMVVHFPGIDHVGHMDGADSPHMHQKQGEMDEVVKNIYNSMTTSPHLSSTLFVLLGDHGMNDQGEHGGNSAGETSAALLFLSPRLQGLLRGPHAYIPPNRGEGRFQYYNSVSQLDIVPTISGLLGLPMPRDNLGAFIPDFLPLWETTEKQLWLLWQNGAQLGMSIDASNLTDSLSLLSTVTFLW